MKIKFQQIEITDQEIVLELFKKAAIRIDKLNIDHWQYWKNPPKEKIDWVVDGIRNNEFFFINDSLGKSIGMVRVLDEDELYWGEQKEKAKYVHSLVVREGYNGKGIGAMVLEEIEELARKESCVFLRLDAVAQNIKLCAYYENLNFKKVGEKKMPLSINNLYEREIQKQ